MKRMIFFVIIVLLLLTGCAKAQPHESTEVHTSIPQTQPVPSAAATETTEATFAETAPIETKPQETNPKESNHQESKPQESKPQETKPQESKPQETEPAETTLPTQPTETEPTHSQPVPVAATMTRQIYQGLNYWLYTPADPVENMPLIVYLHGGSGKGSDLELLTNVDGFPQYVKNGRIAPRAYILFPQCPADQMGWNTLGGKIENLIAHTCEQFGLDTDRVSLTGHSMGGTGTWSIALAKPYLFYKVAPMSGSVKLEESNIAALSHLPIWAVVGDADTIVDPQSSIDMVEALQAAGGNVKLTVLEGADHFAVPALGYLSSGVVGWLIS